jgi:glycosyltransferase involved in cell wall biosynthesis
VSASTAVADIALHRGRPLRVLQGTYEIAGQGMLLARGLRECGCDAEALSYRVDWDGRAGDRVIELDPLPPLARGAAMIRTFLRYAPACDVFHFHFGTSILPRLADVPVLDRLGKKIVFHFHGCDIRNRKHMLAAHRYSTCTECDPFCRPVRQRRLLELAAKHADLVFYSTLDLAESVPGGSHLPLAIDVERWARAARERPLVDPERRDGIDGPVVIGHAPTNRLIKGTRHLAAAVERLRRERPRVELRLMERRPWAEVPDFLAGCDLVVDQLLMGWYSLVAVEAMAMGKPVVLRIRDDPRRAAPEPPIAGADPDTVFEVLRDLVRDPARRAELGARGAAFAREHHDTAVVGRRLLEAYRALW